MHTVTEERNTSDHAPICLQISDRPIRIPAAEHEIFNQANWDGYTAHLKREVRPFNLNRKNTAEIDTILEKIEIATSSARFTHIPKVKFKYTERNTATPKFHRLQKILAQIYNLMHNNSQNAHILRHLRNKKTQTIIKIKLECAIMQSNFWSALLTEISEERNLNPKGFWTRIKPIIFQTRASRITITDTGNRRGNVLTVNDEIEQEFRREMQSKYTPPSQREDPQSHLYQQSISTWLTPI